jgi:hypothetical protein
MPKRPPRSTGRLPDHLFDYAGPDRSKATRPPPRDPALTVVDDWLEIVPITDAELRVFEAHFGDALDEIFGPAACEEALR